MYIAKYDGVITMAQPTEDELRKALVCKIYDTIEETGINYILYNGEYVTEEEYAQRERERIAMLRMTPRDFLLAITSMGIEWAKIKELMAQNPQVEIELNYCQYVYRGNPLLDDLCGNFGVTPEQLDELFISKTKRSIE